MNDPSSLQTASWLRRVFALIVDWTACTLVVMGVLGIDGWSANPYAGLYTLLLFVAESAVLTALSGGSFGKLATRLRTVRVDGAQRPPNPLRCLLRAVLVALVIPPLVFRPEGRGLHDMVAGTASARLQDVL